MLEPVRSRRGFSGLFVLVAASITLAFVAFELARLGGKQEVLYVFTCIGGTALAGVTLPFALNLREKEVHWSLRALTATAATASITLAVVSAKHVAWGVAWQVIAWASGLVLLGSIIILVVRVLGSKKSKKH